MHSQSYTMPFGRYKGARLDALPEPYLTWLLTLGDLREPLCAALRAEYDRRHARRTPPRAALAVVPEVAAAIIGAGVKVLARRHHPDVGGDVEAMQQINATADALRKWAGAA